MPDTIEVNEELGIIEIRSFGQVTREDIAASIAKAQATLKEKGIGKILVDTSEQDTMPGAHQLLPMFADFPRNLRLALLVKQTQDTKKDVEFARNVGFTKGVDVKLFSDRQKALAWLAE
jgi:hypothetical protein